MSCLIVHAIRPRDAGTEAQLWSVGLLLYLFLALAAPLARAEGGRQVVLLDGAWQIAEGSLAERPKAFEHQVPVPGLADMARPAFAGVGVKDKDPRREAFWYRREFTLPGAVPAVARLKIHKACYGTRAWLNGELLGDHAGCFTPAYFDVRKQLRGNGQPNELLIRVGASHTALPESVPWGHDFEKIRYIPGIFDSVELILSGAPHVLRVQAVPDVPGKRVRVVATVAVLDQPIASTVKLTVREAASHKIVGTDDLGAVLWKPGDVIPAELTASIENCRLWSPEDPFLYELEVSTAGDTATARFGMRSFTFDAKSKRAVLNGRPYFLRGTNICIYRFFEDPVRGDKPWREDWVRQVIRAFRDMHWNSCRYCIGFPPELWYRIADEEGLMIQDEFPVWGQTGDLPTLSGQYREWMEERWNHPSVLPARRLPRCGCWTSPSAPGTTVGRGRASPPTSTRPIPTAAIMPSFACRTWPACRPSRAMRAVGRATRCPTAATIRSSSTNMAGSG